MRGMDEPLEPEYQEQIEQLKERRAEALADLFALFHSQLEQIIQFRLDGRLLGRLEPADVLQEAYLNAERRL